MSRNLSGAIMNCVKLPELSSLSAIVTIKSLLVNGNMQHMFKDVPMRNIPLILISYVKLRNESGNTSCCIEDFELSKAAWKRIHDRDDLISAIKETGDYSSERELLQMLCKHKKLAKSA